ncbi:MAG: amidohydrolase family protein [Solirubrobacterales bacterium]|nr:amidohydrolase family protein [Solirubrobacterales bacterium]
MGASTEIPLVDHHCHGIFPGQPEDGFERWISESDRRSPDFDHLDATPLGMAIRAWCSPLLDLEPGASREEYVARRAEIAPEELNARLMRAAGVAELLVDTGITSLDLTPPDELAELAGAEGHEVVRIEEVAERALERSSSVAEFRQEFETALADRADSAVGLKTIVAYRTGLVVPDRPPETAVADRAIERALGQAGRARIDDPDLLHHGIWVGVELARAHRLPIQLHTGLGDTDVDISLADPGLLTPFIRATDGLGVNLTLLHCYPYHRTAGYLAAMYPNVYFDLGLSLNHAAGGARTVMAEAMEMAPFAKQLYASDAIGIAELHHLGALLFRRSLDAVLDGWIGDGLIRTADAERIAAAIASGNARRLYGLEGRSGTRPE